MDLKGDDAFLVDAFLLLGVVDGLGSVKEDLNVFAFGDHLQRVPLSFLYQFGGKLGDCARNLRRRDSS